MQASIGQVENLTGTVASLLQINSDSGEYIGLFLNEIAAKAEETLQELEQSVAFLEQAIEMECLRVEELAQAVENMEQAQADLARAQADFESASAEAAYASDDPIADTAGLALAASAAALAAAEAKFAISAAALAQAQDNMRIAVQNRILMEQRQRLAAQCSHLAAQCNENAMRACKASQARMTELTDAAAARLSKAQQALDRYLSATPSAAGFKTWLDWNPTGLITPANINARLNLPLDQMEHFLQYLYDRDTSFRETVDSYRHGIIEATTEEEKQAIRLKARKNLGGMLGERLVIEALKPLGAKVETQARTNLDGGSYTKTDLIVTGLKHPIILGRGEGMGASADGSVAIEVKCGGADYLYSQKNHMAVQAVGHQKATASMTVCTRNIKDLSEDKEKELRDKLRDAGSPLIGMLPRKEELDEALWGFVSESA